MDKDKVLFTGGVVVAVILWRLGECPFMQPGTCLSPVGTVALYVSVGCAAWGLASLLAGRTPRPPGDPG